MKEATLAALADIMCKAYPITRAEQELLREHTFDPPTFSVQDEYSDNVYYQGSYNQCRTWIIHNYSDDYNIANNKTGRFVSVVWYQSYK